MNKNFFRQYNKLILGSIILFFTALLFNHWTPYAADDYSYMFNLSAGTSSYSGWIFSATDLQPEKALRKLSFG